MSRAKGRIQKVAHRREVLQSAGRSSAVIKSHNPRFPDLAPERPLRRDHSLQPWPLDESDLDLCEQIPPNPPFSKGGGEAGGILTKGGEGAFDALPPIRFLGCLTAAERGVQGNVTLDVLRHPDGSCEIGPFVFAQSQVAQLLTMTLIATTMRESWT